MLKFVNNDYIYRAHARFVCSHKVLFTMYRLHARTDGM